MNELLELESNTIQIVTGTGLYKTVTACAKHPELYIESIARTKMPMALISIPEFNDIEDSGIPFGSFRVDIFQVVPALNREEAIHLLWDNMDIVLKAMRDTIPDIKQKKYYYYDETPDFLIACQSFECSMVMGDYE